MARIGPNQDINDPVTIIGLAYEFQRQSNDYGNRLAQSNAKNPTASGPPILDISIPFKMVDGSTQLLYGDNIDYLEAKYIYNSGLVSNSTIVTYIDLAERFRNYWEILNGVLDQLNDFDSLQTDIIDPEGPFTTESSSGVIRIHGSLGGIAYEKWSYSYSPSQSQSTPTWEGSGPTNYNQLTYPQLLAGLQTINVTSHTSKIAWDTIYWYDKFSDVAGDVTSAFARFGKNAQWVPPLNQQYVQIYNHGLTTMYISLSMNVSATYQTRFSMSVTSWAEIDDKDSYPNPWGGYKSLLPSYISKHEDIPVPGGTASLSDSRSIEIPPGKSAFIGCTASAGTTFPSSGINSISASVTLNDQTIDHSVIF